MTFPTKGVQTGRSDDCSSLPTLEIRIPISPTDKDMRMVHYLLESIQEFGGPVGRAAHCVCFVGADEPPRDFTQEYSWTGHHSIEFHWVDRELFRRRGYHAPNIERLRIESDADVVALLDADLFIAGNFDPVVLRAHGEQRLLGRVAGYSPFAVPGLDHRASQHWWGLIFEEAGLPCPPLDWEHSGSEWGLIDHPHRHCPPYYNYGFLIAPRQCVDLIGKTFETDLAAVDRIVETWFKAQIANTLAIARHGIPCGNLPIAYNFPLHAAQAGNRLEDVIVFHYLGEGEINRNDFATDESLQRMLNRSNLGVAGSFLQSKLRIVSRRISEEPGVLAGRDGIERPGKPEALRR